MQYTLAETAQRLKIKHTALTQALRKSGVLDANNIPQGATQEKAFS